MTEEFNIFKNLEDLKKTNLLDKLKNLETAKTEDLNDSQDLEDFDFDDSFVNNNNNNVKKSPTKRQSNKEKPNAPEKKSKKNVKSRRSSSSTDGSISPTLPLLEHLSEKVNEMPVSRRTRRSLGACKKAAAEIETILENIEPSSSKGRGRGRGRGGGRGRGRGKGKTNNNKTQDLNNSIDLSDNSYGIPTQNSSNDVSTQDEESDPANSTLSIMERFLQQGRRGRARVMRARRQYVAEMAARSTQVDFIDLVSSPLPRVEGFIELDSENEETTPNTRSKQKNQVKVLKNSSESKLAAETALNVSFDEDNPELNIKVNWKGKPEAFKLRKYQKFSIIFKKLAERENITEDSIVFNLNDRIIMADDTPDSINYKIFHFIDGRVLTNRFNSPGTVALAAAANKKRDVNKITVKIQSDKWKKPLQIDIMKTDKFRILYIKCAEELKISIDHLKLSFDGELLELNDTPADLDLEGGELIDLRIKN